MIYSTFYSPLHNRGDNRRMQLGAILAVTKLSYNVYIMTVISVPPKP